MNTIQAYQLTSGGTPARLAVLRKMAAASVNNRNESTRLQPGDWHGARHYTMKTYESAYATLSAGIGQWYSHYGPEFRNERDAHDVCRHLDNGYYTDTYCDDTAIGIVASLTHGRFIAGYRWTSNDERVYFPEVFTDESDAARMADEHARVFAESAFEDSERFNAMTDAESLVESKESDLCEAWEQYRSAWAAFLADPLRHARAAIKAREWVSELIVDLRAFRRELADATRAYERG